MSSSRAALPWLAYLSLSASMALVGAYVGFSKLLVAALPVFLLAWLRFGIAAVAMASWTKRRADEAPMTRHDLGLLFLESFFGNFLFSICMLFGMALSTALAAGVIMAALPGVTALLSWLLLKEKIAKRVWAGIVCAVGGIALVAFSKHRGEGAQGLSILGIALLLGAVFCEAIYVVIGKKLSAKLSPKRISALINLWGLALVTPFGVWQALSFDFATVSAPMWGLLVLYALAASMGTVWLWMTGLRQVPAAQAGVFTVMLPITSAAVGVLFLGEHVSSAQTAAFALALAGVVLATWPERSKAVG